MENQEEKKKSHKWAWIALAALLLFPIVFVMCYPSSSSGAKRTSPATTVSSAGARKELNLKLVDRGDRVLITNNEGFDITDIRLRMNGDYVFTWPVISSGVTFEAHYIDFKKSDGTRFDPRNTRVTRISVFAKQGSAGFTN